VYRALVYIVRNKAGVIIARPPGIFGYLVEVLIPKPLTFQYLVVGDSLRTCVIKAVSDEMVIRPLISHVYVDFEPQEST
jgi:hypothetical protein